MLGQKYSCFSLLSPGRYPTLLVEYFLHSVSLRDLLEFQDCMNSHCVWLMLRIMIENKKQNKQKTAAISGIFGHTSLTLILQVTILRPLRYQSNT